MDYFLGFIIPSIVCIAVGLWMYRRDVRRTRAAREATRAVQCSPDQSAPSDHRAVA
jgi:hypothetical protein